MARNLIYCDPINYANDNIGLQYGSFGGLSVSSDSVVGTIIAATGAGFGGSSWNNAAIYNGISTFQYLYAFIKPEIISSQTRIMGFSNTGGIEATLFINTDGSLSYWWGDVIHYGALVGTTPPLLNIFSSFNSLELIMNFSATSGTLHIVYNGVTVLNISGVKTVASDATTGFPVNQIGYNSLKFKNFTIFDNATDIPANGLGALQVISDLPNADNIVMWTPSTGLTNFNLVNAPDPNLGTTYVSTAIAGFQDLYDYANSPATVDKIYGVASSVVMQHDVGANHIVSVAYKNGINTQLGTALGITSTNYANYYDYETVSPFTGVAWTKAEIDATTIGVNLVS
jgi:hypothetical protein